MGITDSGYLEQIAETGYCVIEDVIAPDHADEIAQEVRDLEEDLGITGTDNSFEGIKTHRIYNLLAQGPTFWAIATNPKVLPVVEGVLDEGMLVSSISSINIGPGEAAQPIHTDDAMIKIPRPHPPVICNSMYALTDFTEENGATRIIPGSHLRDHGPDYTSDYPSIPAEMKKGSVLVWVGSLWHGGGANLMTGEGQENWRIGLAMNYCAGFIRQQENQQLGIPVDTAKKFPPRLQELCGYKPYQGLIGHVNRTSPMRMLDPDAKPYSTIWDQAG